MKLVEEIPPNCTCAQLKTKYEGEVERKFWKGITADKFQADPMIWYSMAFLRALWMFH